jgi:hypothetical protein
MAQLRRKMGTWLGCGWLLLAAACGDKTAAVADVTADVAVGDAAAPADVPADAVVDASAAAVDAAYAPDYGPKPQLPAATGCNTAVGWIPKSLQAISYDDGEPKTSLPKQAWTVAGKPMNKDAVWDAVRFDLERPVRVWGWSIRWEGVPQDPDAALQAGLYADFGNNGFDFWQFDPLWQGARCASDTLKDPLPSAHGDGWLDYALPEPVLYEQPGIVYVAHRREAGETLGFGLDGSLPEGCTDAQKCCEKFSACHSAWNLPNLKNFTLNGQGYFNWNGLSSSLSTDFTVRLWVEELPVPSKTDHVFAPLPDLKPSHRQAFGDYDNDGDDDLLLSGLQLWRNDKGAFTDITAAAKLGDGASGGVWGDYDNDGCLDIFAFREDFTGPDRLYRGDCKGGFTDVTEGAGLSGDQDGNDCKGKGKHAPSAGAAWVDFDGDGKLDLYVSRFQCWDDYSAYTDTPYHNLGGGKFALWAGKQGFPALGNTMTPSRGVNPLDADQDGDIDIFVNNYVLIRNLYFRNDGGTFAEVGQKNGLAGKSTFSGGKNYFGHSIGSAFGDLDGDGDFDAVVANLAHPRYYNFSNKTQVLIQDPVGQWTDIQGDWSQPYGAAGLRFQETHSVPALGDFNHDGALDLVITAVYDGRPTDFYWGNGDGTFTLDRLHAGISATNGWSLALADTDNDGDLDLASQGELLQNQLPAAKKGNWLQVRAVGDGKSNRAGLGAVVRVEAGGKVWVRYVSGGNGQGSQDSATLHFGLGPVSQVDRVRVRFAGGGEQTFEGPIAAGQRLWLYESGKLKQGWTP